MIYKRIRLRGDNKNTWLSIICIVVIFQIISCNILKKGDRFEHKKSAIIELSGYSFVYQQTNYGCLVTSPFFLQFETENFDSLINYVISLDLFEFKPSQGLDSIWYTLPNDFNPKLALGDSVYTIKGDESRLDVIVYHHKKIFGEIVPISSKDTINIEDNSIPLFDGIEYKRRIFYGGINFKYNKKNILIGRSNKDSKIFTPTY